jgi:urea transport system permease protein
VPQVGIINPGEFSPANSIEIIIWVVVGGRGLLLGAVLGAVLVNCAKTVFTGWFPELWTFVLGALFIVVTLRLPKGVLGGLDALAGLRRAEPRAPPGGRARDVGPGTVPGGRPASG